MTRTHRGVSKWPPAVVLGGGVTALSVARSLAAAGVPVHVVDDRYSAARFSRAVSSFSCVGDQLQHEMLAWLGTGPAPAVLLVGNDEGLELIGRHRSRLLELGYLPMEADDRVLLGLLDKVYTYEVARESGIPAPRITPLPNREALETAIEQVEFPCVLKPVHSHVFARLEHNSAKVRMVTSQAELRAEYARLSAAGVDVFLTEVVYGTSDEFVSYYGYLDPDGQPLLSFTKRKLRQYPVGFGTGTFHETTDDPEVAELGLRFLRAVGLRGLGNVEFKRAADGGQLKLIECNSRFTLSHELIRASGMDLALFAYSRLSGRPTPSVDSYRVGMHLWDPIPDGRAFLAYRRLGEVSAQEWLASVARPQILPTFSLTDPVPALARVSWMARNVRNRARPEHPLPSTASPHPGTPVTGASAAGRAPSPSPPRGLNRWVEDVAQSSSRGRAVAARVDLVRASGIGPVWRRIRAEPHLSTLGGGVREQLYERIWTEAAQSSRAEVIRLGPGMLELVRGPSRTRVYHQTVEVDDPVTLHVALDKTLVLGLLAAAGLAHAEHLEWSPRDPAPALAFLQRVGGSCVVKPAAGTGGANGVTPGIRTPAELLRARLHAGAAGERLLIERQAEGAVYRVLIMDGELLDVVRAVPTGVEGDGRSSIETLIRRENERRVAARGAAGLSLVGINLDTVLALHRSGLNLKSIPPAGHRVTLRAATNNSSAQENVTWRGDVCSEVIDECRAAADAVGLRLAGIDVITTDIGQPLAKTSGIIAEVNGTPGLHHHYLVADPDRATRVAIPILEWLLQGRAAETRVPAPPTRAIPIT